MNDYVTDDEQVERIKKWWSDNGNSVIAGLVIGVGGLFGWRYWVDYNARIAAEASSHFTVMTQSLEMGQHSEAINEANLILDEYSSSAYANLARLALAKAFIEQGDFVKAEQQFKLLISSKPEQSIEMLTRKRLSMVLMQQDKLNEALSELEVDYPKEFTAAFEELKGDILARQGNEANAKEAYQRARLAQPPVANPEFLQQKLENLSSTKTG